MFRTLKNGIGADRDYGDPQRVLRLTALQRVLDGTLYDHLPYDFHQERKDGGEYIPLRQRAPCARFNLCRTVVQDSVALLFGEGRFPAVHSEKKEENASIQDFLAATKLPQVMAEAALKGSVGSIAIRLRVLKNRPFFDLLDTWALTPEWADDEPDRLERVTERYKVKGAVLAAKGYNIADDMLGRMHWFQRTWDADLEGWYIPVPVGVEAVQPMRLDDSRSVEHGLGVVPIVWIKNLPGGTEPDGASTFEPAVDDQIEIEYQLSQGGRGLKYSSDPTLVIKEPAAADGEIVKSAGNALVVSENGDAKLLEIGGTAAAAIIEYVKTLRELALESIHGHRASADKVSAAQSGRALELSFQGLVWLVDKLRTSYGENGILACLRLVQDITKTGRVKLVTRDGAALPMASGDLSLQWPPFFPPTHQDRQSDATALATLIHEEVISKQTSTNLIATTYDLSDPEAERAIIEAEIKAKDARLQAQAAQVKANEDVE
ncbi:MAG TPA: phage portal protein [Acidocella sp.]|nr:phage portal protein [Acidocella sp.]